MTRHYYYTVEYRWGENEPTVKIENCYNFPTKEIAYEMMGKCIESILQSDGAQVLKAQVKYRYTE